MAGQLRNVVAGLLLLAVACGDNADAVDTPNEDRGYHSELKTAFVDDCTAAGTDEATCTCWYEALEAEVPFDRFEQLDEDIRSGSTNIPADIQDLAIACAAESARRD